MSGTTTQDRSTAPQHGRHAAPEKQPTSEVHSAGCTSGTTTRRRRLAVLTLAAGGVAVVGSGAFASWDATAGVTSGTLQAGSGTPALLDANGGTFTTGVANLLPADWFHRYVDVRNDGTQANTFTGTVSATGDLAGHVAVEAASCSVAWTTGPGVSTCAGTVTALGAGTPTATTPVTVTHGRIGVGAAAAQHVRYTFTFLSTAPASVQGKSGNVAIAVSNTLVGGTDRTDG